MEGFIRVKRIQTVCYFNQLCLIKMKDQEKKIDFYNDDEANFYRAKGKSKYWNVFLCASC